MKKFKTLEGFLENVRKGKTVELLFKDSIMFHPNGDHIERAIGYYYFGSNSESTNVVLSFSKPPYKDNFIIDTKFIKEYRIYE